MNNEKPRTVIATTQTLEPEICPASAIAQEAVLSTIVVSAFIF